MSDHGESGIARWEWVVESPDERTWVYRDGSWHEREPSPTDEKRPSATSAPAEKTQSTEAEYFTRHAHIHAEPEVVWLSRIIAGAGSMAGPDTIARRVLAAGYQRTGRRLFPPARPVTTRGHCSKCGAVFLHAASCPSPAAGGSDE